MKALDWLRFLNAIRPALIEFGRFLFEKFKGDPVRARAEISRVQDQWSDYDANKARIDAENAALRAQGK